MSFAVNGFQSSNTPEFVAPPTASFEPSGENAIDETEFAEVPSVLTRACVDTFQTSTTPPEIALVPPSTIMLPSGEKATELMAIADVLSAPTFIHVEVLHNSTTPLVPTPPIANVEPSGENTTDATDVHADVGRQRVSVPVDES